MAGMLQDLTKAAKNGGNYTVIVQMKIDTDGKYIAATASDVFSEAAGTAHVIGSQTESDFKRQSDGSRILNLTIVEQNLLRQNMLELLCPVASASSDNDELLMEDNIAKLGSSSGSSFNSSNPVFAVWHFMAGGTKCRHGFIQFKPEGGHDGQKAKQWNLIKLSAYSIDSNGSLVVDTPDDDVFDGFTFTSLATPFQHGKVFEAA